MLEATASSPGATTRRTATRPRFGSINRRSTGWRPRPPASPPSAAAGTPRSPPRPAPRVAAAADAGDPRHGLGSAPHGRPLRRPGRGAGVRQLPRHAAARRPRHQLPRPLPPHQDPAAGRRLRPGQPDSTRPSPASPPRSRPTARTTPPTTTAAAPRQPGDARSERGGLPRPRRRHDHLRARQGDGAHLGRVLRQRHQRHARRLARSRTYRGLPEQEAFDIEYWLLEEAKLQRMPKPKSLAGRIAFVTGGAGGIGSATADAPARRRRLRRPRRHRRRGAGGRPPPAWPRATATTWRAPPRWTSPTRPRSRPRLRRDGRRVRRLDILVSNAGIASSAPIEDTTLELWDRNMLDPRHRLLPGLARGLSDAEFAGASAAPSSSSPPRTASPPRRTPRPTAPPRPPRSTSPAASRSKARRARHPRQRRQSRTPCCAARNLVGRVARPARQHLQDDKEGWRRCTASARC